jgi:glucosylceramidase
MKDFLNHGASAYYYWNISLKQGGVSRWGWAQNSLVTVDEAAKTFKYNYEYYLLKHLSHYVQPGARRLETKSLTGYENLLVFANPDNSIIILIQNDLDQDLPIRVKAEDKVVSATLQADSFNTLVVRT